MFPSHSWRSARSYFVTCMVRRKLIEALVKVGKRKRKRGGGSILACGAKTQCFVRPEFLEAMNTANDLGDNWIRSAISEILDRDRSRLPGERSSCLLERRPKHREFEKIRLRDHFGVQTQYRPIFNPKFIDDREPTLRRLAVEKLLKSARDAEKPEKSKALFEKVLSKGREVDQIKEAKEALEKAGQKIDAQTLMGFPCRLAYDRAFRQHGQSRVSE